MNDDRWITFTMDENDIFEWNPSIMDEKWTFNTKQWYKLHQLNYHVTYLVFTITF